MSIGNETAMKRSGMLLGHLVELQVDGSLQYKDDIH